MSDGRLRSLHERKSGVRRMASGPPRHTIHLARIVYGGPSDGRVITSAQGRQHMTIEQLERPRAADASTITAMSQQESAPTWLAKSFTIDRIVFIVLQASLGYEWLVSGLDKILYGRFPESLGGLLAGVLRVGKIPAPFAALLRELALPHPLFFGWLIEWSETLAGLALLGAALVALLRPMLERYLTP